MPPRKALETPITIAAPCHFANDLRKCVHDYLWPPNLRYVLRTTANSSLFDSDLLLRIVSRTPKHQRLYVTFLSKEYLPIGLEWAKRALSAQIHNFLIFAIDDHTAYNLNQQKLPHVRIRIPNEILNSHPHSNPGGFGPKALGLIYTRTRIVSFLVANGINVVCCDVDALFLNRPADHDLNNADISFQRVVYFPKPLAQLWGFSACAGFVSYSATPQVMRFLKHMVWLQSFVSSDQLALNLALQRSHIKWSFISRDFDSQDTLHRTFIANSYKCFTGMLPHSYITVQALPAASYWRHDFVPLDLSTCVLLHPNSGKTLESKVTTFHNLIPGVTLSL